MIATLLIGLDGATWDVLDPLMGRGLMPALRTLVDRGAKAPLRTVMPPLTPPGWTSLMTGRTPARHGVFDFFRRESPTSEFFRLTTANDISGDTIWTLASKHGKRVLSLNFPVMFPAPAVFGRVVPGGWMPWRQLRLGCYPPGLFDRLKDLPSFDPKELSLDMALEAKAVEGCPPEEYADWVELHIRREERWFDVAQLLLADEPAELVGIVFDGVDKLQHLCWRFLDPQRSPNPEPWEAEMTAACERYFVRLDTIIARLVDLAGPEATVIVASDHGFGRTDEVFFVNSWLAEQGFLAWAEDGNHGPAAATDVGFAQMTRHITLLDWTSTLAYAATPSSQGIHVVATDPRTGRPMTSAARARICDEIADALLEARHPATGRPLVSRVWPVEDAFGRSYTGIAPDPRARTVRRHGVLDHPLDRRGPHPRRTEGKPPLARRLLGHRPRRPRGGRNRQSSPSATWHRWCCTGWAWRSQKGSTGGSAEVFPNAAVRPLAGADALPDEYGPNQPTPSPALPPRSTTASPKRSSSPAPALSVTSTRRRQHAQGRPGQWSPAALPAAGDRARPCPRARADRQPCGLAPAPGAAADAEVPCAHLRPARPRVQRRTAERVHARRHGR